jgi:hypothetical protein
MAPHRLGRFGSETKLGRMFADSAVQLGRFPVSSSPGIYKVFESATIASNKEPAPAPTQSGFGVTRGKSVFERRRK